VTGDNDKASSTPKIFPSPYMNRSPQTWHKHIQFSQAMGPPELSRCHQDDPFH
jgi:hypothetical protein